MPEVKVKVTPKQYGTFRHPNMYPHSKSGVPTLKKYKIYALDTIVVRLGSEEKVKVTVTRKQYATLCDLKMYPHTKFRIPASNYITHMLPTQFRFRLTDGQIVSCVSGLHKAHQHLWQQKSAAPSDVNVTYYAVVCAYLIGLQVALEAVEYAEVQSRL